MYGSKPRISRGNPITSFGFEGHQKPLDAFGIHICNLQVLDAPVGVARCELSVRLESS
jgi:hypothetical protein